MILIGIMVVECLSWAILILPPLSSLWLLRYLVPNGLAPNRRCECSWLTCAVHAGAALLCYFRLPYSLIVLILILLYFIYVKRSVWCLIYKIISQMRVMIGLVLQPCGCGWIVSEIRLSLLHCRRSERSIARYPSWCQILDSFPPETLNCWFFVYFGN